MTTRPIKVGEWFRIPVPASIADRCLTVKLGADGILRNELGKPIEWEPLGLFRVGDSVRIKGKVDIWTVRQLLPANMNPNSITKINRIGCSIRRHSEGGGTTTVNAGINIIFAENDMELVPDA